MDGRYFFTISLLFFIYLFFRDFNQKTKKIVLVVNVILALAITLTWIYVSPPEEASNLFSTNPSTNKVEKTNSNSSTSSGKKDDTPCIGDQGCIDKVRTNFESTGKTILNESKG
jgi:hypothetical protein